MWFFFELNVGKLTSAKKCGFHKMHFSFKLNFAINRNHKLFLDTIFSNSEWHRRVLLKVSL